MRATLTTCLLLIAACSLPLRTSPDSEEVELRVEAAAARDSVRLVLSNDSNEEVGFNLCTSALERRTGAAWEPVAEDRVCTMELRLLPVGREAAYTLGIPAGLTPGVYRYRAGIEMMASGAAASVVSDGFEVAR
jgi:hypothetical protein